MKQEKVLLFDGVCNLCTWSVQFILRHDQRGRIMFASLQSKAAQRILNTFHRDSANFDSVLYIKHGEIYERSDAALEVIKEFHPAWQLLLIFKILPRPLRDAMYDCVAQYRYKVFGKRDMCYVPGEDISYRFLDSH